MKNGYAIDNMNTASDAAKPALEQVQEHYQFIPNAMVIPNALGAMVESPEAVKAYLALDELVSLNSLTDNATWSF